MKSKLLALAVGAALLGASALAAADDDRRHGRDRGPSYHGRYDGGWHAQGPGHHWHPRKHGHWHPHKHGHGHGPKWRHRGWHAPAYRHYGYAPRHYGGYDDGVTIIFKGRFD